jgi:hypothetical protein
MGEHDVTENVLDGSEIVNNLRSLLNAAQAAELRHREARDARRAAWAAVRESGTVVLTSWEEFDGESAREDDLAVVEAVVGALRADKIAAATRQERDGAVKALRDVWWDVAGDDRADLPADLSDDALSVPS